MTIHSEDETDGHRVKGVGKQGIEKCPAFSFRRGIHCLGPTVVVEVGFP